MRISSLIRMKVFGPRETKIQIWNFIIVNRMHNLTVDNCNFTKSLNFNNCNFWYGGEADWRQLVLVIIFTASFWKVWMSFKKVLVACSHKEESSTEGQDIPVHKHTLRWINQHIFLNCYCPVTIGKFWALITYMWCPWEIFINNTP